MATVTESFESGTTGASVTTTAVGAGTGTGTGTYSTEQAAHGTKSMKVVQATAGRYVTHSFTAASTTRYARMYVYFAAAPSASTTVLSAFSGGVLQGHVRILTGQTVQLRNTASAQVGSLSTALALSTWHRIEMQYVPAGTATVRIFSGANVDGPTPDQTLTGAVAGTATFDQFLLGPSSAATWTTYMDDLGVSDTTWVGSASPTSTYPANGLTAAVSGTAGRAGVIAAAKGASAATSSTAARASSRASARGTTAATSTTAARGSARTGARGTAAATSSSGGRASIRAVARGLVAGVSAALGSATARLRASGTAAATSTTSGRAGIILAPIVHPARGTTAATSGASGRAGLRVAARGSTSATSGSTGQAAARVRAAGLVEATTLTQGPASTLYVAAGQVIAVSSTSGAADVLVATQFQGRILAVELITPTASAELSTPVTSAHLSIPAARGVLS